MANVKRAIRLFCAPRCPEFSSFDSTAYPSDPTDPGTIHMSDVHALAVHIGYITKPQYNIQKCQMLITACRFIADCFEQQFYGDTGTVVSIEPFVKELHRVLQQVKGLLEGYSAAEAWSPLLLLQDENTEAIVHLIYDLHRAFVAVHEMDWTFPGAYDCGKVMARSLADREAEQIESSGIGPGDYFMQKYVYSKTSPYFEGFVLLLDPQDLRIERKIAEGRYAQIYEGIWCGQIRVAIKTYISCCHDLCRQEASVHAKLKHPNIVQFIGVVKDEDGNASSAVTELMSSTTLQDEMDNRREEGRPFTNLEAINIIIQIARGMSYLHRKGVMHRDLKPSNILICSCKNCTCVGNMGSLHVKIADFGDAKTESSELGTPNVGTLRWMAPEVHSFNRRDPSMKAYTCQADVYSFGILCYEIVTGRLPFTGVGTKEYYERIGAGERPTLPSECSEGLARLIKSCWVGEASERPDFEHICHVLHGLREVEIFGRIVTPLRSDEHHRYRNAKGDAEKLLYAIIERSMRYRD